MTKRKKLSRSVGLFCNTLCTDNHKVYQFKDCVYIGKQNMEKWNEIKSKLNFLSDHEFASYLLESFLAEKRSLLNVSTKGVSNNSTTPTYSDDAAPNCIGESTSKTLEVYKNSSTGEDENNSSVIVINKPMMSHSSTDIQEDVCESSTTNDVTLEEAVEPFETDNPIEMIALKKSKNENSCSKSKLNLDNEATLFKTDLKLRKNRRNHRDDTTNIVLANRKKSERKRKKKLKSVNNRLQTDSENGSLEVQSSNASMKVETAEFQVPTETKQTMESERVAFPIGLCADCELHHLQGACPLRKPLHTVSDTVGSECASEADKSLAEASLPPCLELRVVDSKHGFSVVASQVVPVFTQFGPLVGQPVFEREIPDDSTMEHIWELSDGNTCSYMTTSDPNRSNWLRYVRPADVRSSRNLEVILRGSQLMFVTTVVLNVGDELFFWAENTNSAWSQKKLCKTKCGGCNLSFSHTLYYRLHCAVFHDPAYSLTVRKYHCKVCGMSVLGKENIVKHAAENHNGKGAYQCQYCQKFFLRLNYLEMHRTYGCSANPNRARPLCDYCGRKFCQPQKLKVHIKRMHSEMLEVLREFQCKRCQKVLGSRAALQRHNKEVHQRDIVGAFTCDRCGKMFQNKSNLKIHMLTHSGVKPFKCKEADCLAAFTTKQCLQFHYRKVHGLAESVMPPIERSIEYTFAAYAGGRRPSSVNSDSQCSSEGEDSPDKYLNDEPSQLSPPISVTSESVHDPSQDTFNQTIITKGSKKWIGAAADCVKANVFDFDEDDKEEDINVSHIEVEPAPLLFHSCKQDSSNASLLVEAALDAAEREIDMPSKLPSPMALVTNKDVYPELRSHMSPPEYPVPDQSQSPPLPIEICYSTAMSPRHPYSVTSHYDFRLSPPPAQVDTFHLEDSRYDLHHRRAEESSNDEGVNGVQNLSIGMKNKPLQLDIPYKYESLEDRTFECTEGLDMSRTGSYHHSFVSMTPRYPPTLYEPRSYSHTDVLRVVNFSHSVDLSLPRSHHQLTPPMNPAMIEPIRLISSPPPPYQSYPLATSPLSYSRAPHSPSYHHYSTSY